MDKVYLPLFLFENESEAKRLLNESMKGVYRVDEISGEKYISLLADHFEKFVQSLEATQVYGLELQKSKSLTSRQPLTEAEINKWINEDLTTSFVIRAVSKIFTLSQKVKTVGDRLSLIAAASSLFSLSPKYASRLITFIK